MSNYIGDFADNAIVVLGAFTTNAADGGRESFSAGLEEADITIYSDDGDGTFTAMTLDASTIIITENPGSQVGVYLVAVDMNNDADFTTGKDYIAVLYPDETVDSQSVAGVLAHWSCENRSVQAVRGAVGSVTGAVGSVTGNVGGNVAGSVASVTAGVTLADDAISAAKYDESTAFPLKSADTGATAVARTGADSDTLETLSDQIDGTATPGAEMDLVDAPNATAVTAIQNGLSTYDGSDTSGTTTLLSRLSATRAGYLDNLSAGAVATAAKLLAYFQLLFRSDAAIETDNATELTDINADGGSGAGNYSAQTDSVEALRDRGDNAWITATGFSTLDAAAVNAEVVDALATDTYAEPAQGAPGATVSLATKIGFLYKAFRNKKTQTATQKSLYNDDATTVDHKSTVSDDGTTYTEGELGTGP